MPDRPGQCDLQRVAGARAAVSNTLTCARVADSETANKFPDRALTAGRFGCGQHESDRHHEDECGNNIQVADTENMSDPGEVEGNPVGSGNR